MIADVIEIINAVTVSVVSILAASSSFIKKIRKDKNV